MVLESRGYNLAEFQNVSKSDMVRLGMLCRGATGSRWIVRLSVGFALGVFSRQSGLCFPQYPDGTERRLCSCFELVHRCYRVV